MTEQGREGKNEVIIEAKALRKYFKITSGSILNRRTHVVKAVDGVDFNLRRHETLGLVGESGCGKTTTAKLLLRLEQATSGRLLFRGKDIYSLRGSGLRAYRRAVQAVFQDPYGSLNPRLTVGRIVAEPLIELTHGMSKAEIKERVASMLETVGLSPILANSYPHELSGGQRQRVAVARALTTTPDCILLDEPVSALDVSIRAQLMNLLRELQERFGLSYLLIAHDLAVVKYLSTQIGIMYLGRLVEKAESEELCSRPLHPYTEALLGNALPSHPDDLHEEVILPGEVPSSLNPPTGCNFHPRCSRVMPICSQEEPELREEGSQHLVACHLYRHT